MRAAARCAAAAAARRWVSAARSAGVRLETVDVFASAGRPSLPVESGGGGAMPACQEEGASAPSGLSLSASSKAALALCVC